ncbi:DinB family protein [Paenibacillus pini]|uniref:DinB-like domain-containing protein n=1 Tax=Paenibacillus pini JCM 16418 TaxID=1236976 RepID=W7YTP1_9BACL|nr:DinB family protein [Paenibacillus pini]GAF10553.1 hypothetical protein JCM16418_4763 [Paenibacillus pini JCM 16418]
MSFESVYPIYRTARDSFQKSAQSLTEEDFTLKLSSNTSSIGFMVRHNAEVEYMFAEWFFNKSKPEDVTFITNGPEKDGDSFGTLEENLAFSQAADQFLTEAMRELPVEAWDEPVKSPMGLSTPRQAVGRVLYHCGLHAGQISLIRKVAKASL